MYNLPNGKTVYPEDIECVHDPINGKGGIYIGNLEAAQNIQTLKKHGIKAVLTAAKGIFLDHPKNQIPFQLYIPGQDHERFDMSKYFSQSVSFIRDTLEKTNILVHCLAGVSRSVSLVMAYFIKYHKMNYDSVYTKIKARRKIIHPNDGFITQLKIYENECRERGSVLQRSNIHEIRSSYSPSKRIDRRGYQGIYASPQKGAESPDKGFSRNIGSSGVELYSRYQPPQTEKTKNPELYKSIVQEFSGQRGYKESTPVRNMSPDRYQKQNRMNSSAVLKRLSSVNVEMQARNEGNQRIEMYSTYQRYDVRNRIRSDYKPLDSIQNKQYDIDSEIDKKIAQIRKKYQEYTKKSDAPQDRLDRSRLQKKYSNISTIQEGSENSNIDDLMELKLRKMGTSYNRAHVNDIYIGIGVRNNNYLNDVSSSNTSNYMSSRMRRLQSYQA